MTQTDHSLKVLVTRPLEQAAELLQAVQQAGSIGVPFPLLKIEPLNHPYLEEKLRVIENCDALICVSGNAARFGFEALAKYSITPRADLQWFGLGKSTADLLREHGLSVIAPERAGTSEVLLALPWLQNVMNKRIMMWRGVGGRELLGETLSRNGATMEYVELYQRVIPAYADNELDRVLLENQIEIIMITSGQILSNLWQLAQDRKRLVTLPVIVPSERVAAQANALGFTNIICAYGADEESMINGLQQFSHKPT
jgi:uroporphyrinogen-III synthase